MPTTLSPKRPIIADGRTERLLRAIAAEKGHLFLDEVDFEQNYEHEPFFTSAVNDALIGYSSGGAYSVNYRVFLKRKGWAAIGIDKRSFIDRILALFV